MSVRFQNGNSKNYFSLNGLAYQRETDMKNTIRNQGSPDTEKDIGRKIIGNDRIF